MTSPLPRPRKQEKSPLQVTSEEEWGAPTPRTGGQSSSGLQEEAESFLQVHEKEENSISKNKQAHQTIQKEESSVYPARRGPLSLYVRGKS